MYYTRLSFPSLSLENVNHSFQFAQSQFHTYCSIAVPRALFDLDIEKLFRQPLCISTLVPLLLSSTYCDFYRSLCTKNGICSFHNFLQLLLITAFNVSVALIKAFNLLCGNIIFIYLKAWHFTLLN